ncbi:Coronin-2B, partial [Nowakowskiella sp. JEL0078]
VFVWFGVSAKVKEKIIAMETVLEYVKKSSNHSSEVELLVTYAFQEPPEFTKYFHGWTRSKFPKNSPNNTQQRVRQLKDVLLEFKTEIFTIDELLSEKLPEQIDPTKLEMYLSEEDFESIFKMTKQEYSQMHSWKRERIKKEVGFF